MRQLAPLGGNPSPGSVDREPKLFRPVGMGLPGFSALAAAFLFFAAPPARAQGQAPAAPSLPPGLAEQAERAQASEGEKLDSLRRAITREALTDKDKRQIRACDRDKDAFLRGLRSGEREYAELNQALTAAKLQGQGPDRPEVQRLLERKYALENRFQESYLATPRGRACRESEDRRNRAVEAALNRNRQYQDLLRKARESGAI